MTKVELSLPDQTISEIDRVVEQGDFINREQAIEELLSMGISEHTTSVQSDESPEEEMFGQMTDEQQDPAMKDDDRGDEYTL